MRLFADLKEGTSNSLGRNQQIPGIETPNYGAKFKFYIPA